MIPATRTLLLACALAAGSAGAGAVHEFAAPITESDWDVSGNPLVCRLSHRIEGFGRAVFLRRAGGGLEFRLEPDPGAPRGAGLRLEALPAPWMHGVQARELGPVLARETASPFHIEGETVRELLASLGDGYFPTFSYRAERPARAKVRVSLSAVRFQDAEERFQKCVASLLPTDFSGIQTSRLHFAPGSAALGPAARSRLEQVASWMKLDSRITAATVVGHSDGAGNRRRNYLLSQRRAMAVRDYLVAQGVDAGRIRVRFHGEEKPLASNATESGRRQNRRVDIRLHR